MRTSHRGATAVVIAMMILAAGFSIHMARLSSPGRAAGPDHEEARTAPAAIQAPQHLPRAGAPPLTPRQQKLRELEDKWLAVGERTASQDPKALLDQATLARESAMALSCSVEMLQLYDFLKQNGTIKNHLGSSRNFLENQMRYLAVHEEFRQQLPETIREADSGSAESRARLSEWCYEAANEKDATQADGSLYTALLQSDSSGRFAASLKLGSLVIRADTDLPGSIGDTVSLFSQAPYLAERALNQEMGKAPPDFDYAALLETLPQAEPDKEASGALHTMTSDIFRSWAENEPSAATAYTLSHPGLLNGEGSRELTLHLLRGAPDVAISWVKALPSGLAREAVALTMIQSAEFKAAYPDEIPGIVSLIESSNGRLNAGFALRPVDTDQ